MTPKIIARGNSLKHKVKDKLRRSTSRSRSRKRSSSVSGIGARSMPSNASTPLRSSGEHAVSSAPLVEHLRQSRLSGEQVPSSRESRPSSSSSQPGEKELPLSERSFKSTEDNLTELSEHQHDLLRSLSKRKYVLRTTCGPSYDRSSHVDLPVNSPNGVTVSNEFMTVKIKLRIRDFQGLPLTSQQHTPYFDHPVHLKDQYSVAFSFLPKVDIPSVDCRWGNDFDHSIRERLPPGFNTAFKIVKEFIDPGLTCDAYGDEPWVFGPAMSCWFILSVGDRVGEHGEFPDIQDWPAMAEGGAESGQKIREEIGMPAESEKRRKWSLRQENREKFTFEKGRWYQGDFYNPYLDFNNFALKLPGFSLNVIKYINNKTHQLRYVFKNVATGDVYFVVVMTLLFGKELQTELATAGMNLADGSDSGRVSEGDTEDEFVDAPEYQMDLP